MGPRPYYHLCIFFFCAFLSCFSCNGIQQPIHLNRLPYAPFVVVSIAFFTFFGVAKRVSWLCLEFMALQLFVFHVSGTSEKGEEQGALAANGWSVEWR